ncbi:hypothetical protein ACJJI3_22795 [Microbulbifer sp. ZKSA004]|uniref:hypothetical protein n=1 Tax=Microbulbifer sp. ZKSA004 TaxID=3243389 RepID=UPI00403919DB
MSQKYIVEGQRRINTYAYMAMSAEHSLECASKNEEGCFYQFMSSLIFSAFTLEAYMNHIGNERIEYWEEIESIRYLDKLKVLYLNLGLEFDKSKRPLQTIIQLVKFRNLMAHGKSENISGSKVISTPTLDPGTEVVEAEWEKFCNSKEAKRALDDVKEIVELLNSSAGNSDVMLWSFGGGSSVTSLHNP